MRDLARNMQRIFYRLYDTEVEILDPDGEPTGSFASKYHPMQETRMCISSNRGTADANMFGMLEDYDRTMSTSDTNCPIDENTILWIDNQPTDGVHNYVVTKRAPWKNSIAFAIKRIKVRV